MTVGRKGAWICAWDCTVGDLYGRSVRLAGGERRAAARRLGGIRLSRAQAHECPGCRRQGDWRAVPGSSWRRRLRPCGLGRRIPGAWTCGATLFREGAAVAARVRGPACRLAPGVHTVVFLSLQTLCANGQSATTRARPALMAVGVRAGPCARWSGLGRACPGRGSPPAGFAPLLPVGTWRVCPACRTGNGAGRQCAPRPRHHHAVATQMRLSDIPALHTNAPVPADPWVRLADDEGAARNGCTPACCARFAWKWQSGT